MSAADELIARLRARAADPERRVDVRPSQFMAGVSTLDLGGLMGMLGSVSSDLRRVVAANQAGTPVDPDLHAKAVSIGASMSTPVATALPAVASAEELAALEAAIRMPLPPFLRRVYEEVADGGFGPGGGLLGANGAAAAYARMREGSELPRGAIVAGGAAAGRRARPGLHVRGLRVARRPGRRLGTRGLGEFSGEKASGNRSETRSRRRSRRGSNRWVGSKTQAEQQAEMMQNAMAQAQAQSRAYWRNMTPEQRASYGLSDAAMRRPDGRGRRGSELAVARAEGQCTHSKAQPRGDQTLVDALKAGLPARWSVRWASYG